MPKKAVKARFGLDKLQKIVDTVKVSGRRKFVVKLDRKSENDTFAHHYIDLNAKKDVDYHKLSNDLVPQIKSFLASTMIERGAIKVGTAPCPKHVFLKYFSIKAELLDANITADLGSRIVTSKFRRDTS